MVVTCCLACQTPTGQPISKTEKASFSKTLVHHRQKGLQVIHVFVALCDNVNQGIVPVPKAIGNGQDAASNLYWGCAYGISSYFKNSNAWQVQKASIQCKTPLLDRIVFKHKTSNTFLIADAYDGAFIKQCTIDMLQAASGASTDSIQLSTGEKIYMAGNANLVCYVGHNGLMDFKLAGQFNASDTLKREAIVLACISKNYYTQYLQQTKAKPLILSTGLMAPEAYVLHDAIHAWIKNENPENIRNAAAAAYSKYQHCSLKAAKNLLAFNN